MKTEIETAIARSISHTEIARTNVTFPADSRSAEETIIDTLDAIGADDADCVQENDGSYDAWGSLNGSDFRIRISAV